MALDVFDSRELQATLIALKVVPKEVSAQTRKHTKKLVDAEWQKGLTKRAATPLQRRVLAKTAVSTVSNTNIKLKSASKGRIGRTTPDRLKGGAEFGANIEAYSRYTRKNRRKGGTHQVTRRTMRQFGHFRKGGRVVFPTAYDLIPRIASMYTQTLIRTAAEAFEK